MYLLDTNALITLLYGDVSGAVFSQNALIAMMDADRLFVSVVSIWEIAIKLRIGRIDIRDSIADIFDHCEETGVDILPIEKDSISRTVDIPLRPDHKDPFDRLIIATAAIKELTLISSDEKMNGYGVEILR